MPAIVFVIASLLFSFSAQAEIKAMGRLMPHRCSVNVVDTEDLAQEIIVSEVCLATRMGSPLRYLTLKLSNGRTRVYSIAGHELLATEPHETQVLTHLRLELDVFIEANGGFSIPFVRDPLDVTLQRDTQDPNQLHLIGQTNDGLSIDASDFQAIFHTQAVTFR